MRLSPDYRFQFDATVPDGKVARGAWDHLMQSHMADADRYFEREMGLYPDNLAAYRHRWFLSDAGKDP